MHPLTALILEDMKPALGVTEPAAIALACAFARSYLTGSVKSLVVSLNSGMYKNAFTCGVPGSPYTGILISAALGITAGNPDKGLEVLSDVTDEDHAAAKKLVSDGCIRADVSSISPDISIKAQLTTTDGYCEAEILHTHTNLQYIKRNGKLVYGKEADVVEACPAAKDMTAKNSLRNKMDGENTLSSIHGFTLSDFLHYIKTVGEKELEPLRAAYDTNLELFRFSMASDRTVIAKQLLSANGGAILSENELATAQLLCNGAIEGRVLGLNRAAMSITGSGAHGIICTMPLYAVQKIRGLEETRLLRATALSYLITMYIKEYSGRLSAFCGCGIAAGTGMACALAWLNGGNKDTITKVINNMAAGITGMICDGGNHGCTMKGIVAVDAAWRAVSLASHGISIEAEHGICAATPEEAMRQMGQIADPGMRETERTILDIMQAKADANL
ncbi:MAG: serine dehydratase subunit alpha family protein [Lachnospiraceae bacterium]|nr:serine dehydratase subunit alpha family protein [Lachnospiraceae bacterium]